MTRNFSVLPAIKIGAFLLFLLLLLIHSPSMSQTRIKLDSVKAIEHNLKGQERIDALKYLTQEYAYIDMDSAKLYLSLLADYATQIDDARALAIAALLKGNFLYDEGKYVEAQKYNREALDRSKHIQDTGIIARSYLNIGSTADASGVKDSAIINYLNAIEYFELLEDSVNSAYLKINIGLVFKSLEEYPKALGYYKDALTELVRLKDDFGITTVNTNLASLLIEMNEYDSAIYYGKKGVDGYNNLGYPAYTMFPLRSWRMPTFN